MKGLSKNVVENLKIIKNKDYILYSKIIKNIENVSPEKSKDGNLTYRFNHIYVESPFLPTRNAEKIINRISNEKHDKNPKIIFIGSGLGYHINYLSDNDLEGSVLIEKNIYIFIASLYVIKPAMLEKIELLIDIDEVEIRTFFQKLEYHDYLIVKHPVSFKLNKNYYLNILKIINYKNKEIFASSVTTRYFDRVWKRNVLLNIKNINERIFSTNRLKGKFSGSIILVASGPSTELEVDKLKEAYGKIPIIALLPSYAFLKSSGVRPDALFTTDPGFWNKERLINKCEVPLFTTFSVNHTIVDNWRGNVYMFNHDLEIEKIFDVIYRNTLSIPMQGTSSIVLILLARLMGFNRIYLFGYDFSFRGIIKDHHSGAGFERYFILNTNRLRTWYTGVISKMVKEKIIKLDNSVSIYTTGKLLLYKKWFEDWIAGDDLIGVGNVSILDGIKSFMVFESGTKHYNFNSMLKENSIKIKDVIRDSEDLKSRVESILLSMKYKK